MPVQAGDRIRARAALLAIEEGDTWLQIKRRVTLENKAGEQVLEADTLTRLYW
jgi:acyl dehydratase